MSSVAALKWSDANVGVTRFDGHGKISIRTHRFGSSALRYQS